MNQKQIFKEIQSHMPRFEDVLYERADDCMNVYIADKKEFCVNDAGFVEQYNSNEDNSERYYEVNYSLRLAATLVREYANAMSQAPDLNVPNLSQPYKLLAQYGNIVLAGKVLKSGSFEFVTWRQSNNGVEHGNYFGNKYQKAKEDFATRSGLVNEYKLFSSEEYVELYHCVCDKIEGGAE